MRVILGCATCLGVWGLGCSSAEVDFSAAAIAERREATAIARDAEYVNALEDLLPPGLLTMKKELGSDEFARKTFTKSLYADPTIVTEHQFLNDLKNLTLGSGEPAVDVFKSFPDNLASSFSEYNEIMDGQHRASVSLYESNHIEKEFKATSLYAIRSRALIEDPVIQELLADDLVRSYYTPYYCRYALDRVFSFLSAVIRASEHDPEKYDYKEKLESLFDIDEIKTFLNGLTKEEFSEYLKGTAKIDTLYKIATIGSTDPDLISLFRTIPEVFHEKMLENVKSCVFSMPPTLLKGHLTIPLYHNQNLDENFKIVDFIQHKDIKGDATLDVSTFATQFKMSLTSYEACPYALRLAKILAMKYDGEILFPQLYSQGSPEFLRNVARSIRQFASNSQVDKSIIVEVELKNAIYNSRHLNIVEKHQQEVFESMYQNISDYGQELVKFYKDENDTWNLEDHLQCLALESEETLRFYNHFIELTDEDKTALQNAVKDLTRDVKTLPMDQYYSLVRHLVTDAQNLPDDTVKFLDNTSSESKINRSTIIQGEDLSKVDRFFKFTQIAFSGRYDADTMIGVLRNFPKEMQEQMIDSLPADFQQSPSANTDFLAKAIKKLDVIDTVSKNVLQVPGFIDGITQRPETLCPSISARKYNADKVANDDPNYFRNVNSTPTDPEQSSPQVPADSSIPDSESEGGAPKGSDTDSDKTKGKPDTDVGTTDPVKSNPDDDESGGKGVVPVPNGGSRPTPDPLSVPAVPNPEPNEPQNDPKGTSGAMQKTDEDRPKIPGESGDQGGPQVPAVPRGDGSGHSSPTPPPAPRPTTPTIPGKPDGNPDTGKSGNPPQLPGKKDDGTSQTPRSPSPKQVPAQPHMIPPTPGLPGNTGGGGETPTLPHDQPGEGTVIPIDPDSGKGNPGNEPSNPQPGPTPVPKSSCVGTLAKASVVIVALLGIAAGATYFFYPPKKGEKPQDYMRRLAQQAKLLPKKAKSFFKSDQLLEEASPQLMDREDFM